MGPGRMLRSRRLRSRWREINADLGRQAPDLGRRTFRPQTSDLRPQKNSDGPPKRRPFCFGFGVDGVLAPKAASRERPWACGEANPTLLDVLNLKDWGRVAQVVEQCPFKAWVAGSNPAALTKVFEVAPLLPALRLAFRVWDFAMRLKTAGKQRGLFLWARNTSSGGESTTSLCQANL